MCVNVNKIIIFSYCEQNQVITTIGYPCKPRLGCTWKRPLLEKLAGCAHYFSNCAHVHFAKFGNILQIAKNFIKNTLLAEKYIKNPTL